MRMKKRKTRTVLGRIAVCRDNKKTDNKESHNTAIYLILFAFYMVSLIYEAFIFQLFTSFAG